MAAKSAGPPPLKAENKKSVDKVSADDAEKLLQSFSSSRITSKSRSCLLLAYASLAKRRPARAKKLFYEYIGRLIDSREDASTELWQCYLVETKQEERSELVNFDKMLCTNLNALKLLTLRALPFLSQKPSNETILGLVESLNTDNARTLAVDYWTSLSSPAKADRRAILLVFNDIGSPTDELITKVRQSTAQFAVADPKMSQMVEESPKLQSLVGIEPNLAGLLESHDWISVGNIVQSTPGVAAKVLKAVNARLAQASLDEIEQIVGLCLILASVSPSDTFKRAVSNILYNMGRKVRPNPRFIEIWGQSLRIELDTQQCTTLLEKATRLAAGIIETDVYVPILDSGLERLSELAEAHTDLPTEYGAIAAALNKLVEQDKLKCASYRALEFVLQLSVKENTPKVFDLLLALGPASRESAWAEIYEQIVGEPPKKGSAKGKSVEQRYQMCASGSADVWYSVHQGFFDLRPQLNTSLETQLLEAIWSPTPSSVTLEALNENELTSLEQILQSWAAVEVHIIAHGHCDRAVSPMLQVVSAACTLQHKQNSHAIAAVIMDTCMRVSQLYRYVGNIKDSFMYLKQAYKHAVRSDAPVREAVYSQMLNSLALFTDTPQATGIFTCSHDIPDDIFSSAKSRCNELPLGEDPSTVALPVFTQAKNKLMDDAVYGIIPDCVVTVPPLLGESTRNPAVAALTKELPMLLDSEIPSNWDTRKQLSQLTWSAAMTVAAVSSPQAASIARVCEAPKYAYVPMCRAALEPQKPEKLDTGNLIVISLNFRTDSEICVSRLGPGYDELHVTLPFSREDNESIATLSEVMDQITELTNTCHSDDGLMAGKSSETEVGVEERRAYWSNRGRVEKSFEQLLYSAQKDWFRGFTGLISPYYYEDTSALSSAIETTIRRYFKVSVSFPSSIAQLIAGAGPNLDAEGIKDLIYFIADSLQLHGKSIDYDEIAYRDMVPEIRSALRSYHDRATTPETRHVVLIPNTKCQNFPWEALPALRGVSVSRFLSLELLQQALQRAPVTTSSESVYYTLNPENNLERLQADFEADLRLRGWQGTVGRPPTEGQVLNALREFDWYIYLGHGSGQMCARPHQVQKLPRCGNVILMGCSSARTRGGMLEYDGYGPHVDYAMAGCSLMIGNLWDVADRDINRFSKELLTRIFDNHETVGQAVAEARAACVLRFCTGAAPVIYGLPYATAR